MHGLKGDRLETWTWVGNKREEVFWPRDLLLPDLLDSGVDARIMTYGYNSEPSEMLGAASTNKLHDHAVTFVNELYYNRRVSITIVTAFGWKRETSELTLLVGMMGWMVANINVI